MQGLHFINEGLLGLVDGEKGSSLHACIKSAIEISSTTTVSNVKPLQTETPIQG